MNILLDNWAVEKWNEGKDAEDEAKKAMKMKRGFRFGRFRIEVVLPEWWLDELDELYIASFGGGVLPERDLAVEIDFDPSITTAQRGHFGLLPHLRADSGSVTHFNFALEPEPASRADFWPAKVLIPVLNQCLFESGVAPIHASSVVSDEEALLFVGRSGSGKSTTAEMLISHGASALGDDRALVWEESGSLFAAASFERQSPFQRWAKRRPEIDQPKSRFSPVRGEAFRVREIYFPVIHSGPSSSEPVSRAAAQARLAVSGAGENAANWNLPPAFSLTLGDEMTSLIGKISLQKKTIPSTVR